MPKLPLRSWLRWSAANVPTELSLCAARSSRETLTVAASRSYTDGAGGVLRSRKRRLLVLGATGVVDKLVTPYCFSVGRPDGSGCCEVYSRGECRTKPTSVAALDGARNRASSSGSSVAARRLRPSSDVRRFGADACVGVSNSPGELRGLVPLLRAIRLLRRASSRLSAREEDAGRVRSASVS